jgi:outer membrane protein TolC
MPGETSLSLGGGEGEKTANYSASAKPGADFTPYAGRRAEELALAQARKLISSTEADVARSFESLVANYRMSSKSRDVAERRRDAALKKRNVSAKLLETGNITRVDYLKSEEDLYKAEIEFMDSVIALIAAERAIERALDIAPESLPGFIAKIEESK